MAGKTKRSHGTGSLWQEKRARGRKVWVGQVRVGNRQYQRTLGDVRRNGASHGLTGAGAERALRDVRARIEEDPATASNDPDHAPATIAQIGAEHLAHLVEVIGAKKATVQDYRIYLARHLVPFFADRPLREISPRDVEAFMRHQRDRGLAAGTISNHVNYLHSLFVYAEKREIVPRNAVKLADKPRTPRTDPDVRFLTLEEIEALLRAVPDGPLRLTDRALILTAAMTGLRQGELVGLRWRDVDWAAGVIRVRKSITRGEEGTPKSRRSSRYVPMEDRVAAELERHFQRSFYRRDDDKVFCHPHTGNPRDAAAIRDSFYKAMVRAGMRDRMGRSNGITFHSTRHTFGTRMAAAGAPMRAIQEWMGHKDIQTTMIYADYAPDPSNGREWVRKAFAPAEREPLVASDHDVVRAA
jgi:integrase